MEALNNTRIRFFLEPISKLGFDDPRNPNKKKNIKYFRIYYWLFAKIILFTLSLPILAISCFLVPWVTIVNLPTILVLVVYLLKLKIYFQRVSKKIIEPVQQLSPGDFVAHERKSKLYVYLVKKKSMGLYYLKRVEFHEIYSIQTHQIFEPIIYNEIKIIKASTLYQRYVRVVPIPVPPQSKPTLRKAA